MIISYDPETGDAVISNGRRLTEENGAQPINGFEYGPEDSESARGIGFGYIQDRSGFPVCVEVSVTFRDYPEAVHSPVRPRRLRWLLGPTIYAKLVEVVTAGQAVKVKFPVPAVERYHLQSKAFKAYDHVYTIMGF